MKQKHTNNRLIDTSSNLRKIKVIEVMSFECETIMCQTSKHDFNQKCMCYIYCLGMESEPLKEVLI